MPTKTLTEAAILKTRPKEGRVELWDAVARGLCIRVSADGSRVWSVRYRLDSGKRRRMKLGVFVPASKSAYENGDFNPFEVEPGRLKLTITQARSLAGVLLGKEDPQGEKAQKRNESREAQAHIFEALAVDFLKDRIGFGTKKKEKKVESTVKAALAGEKFEKPANPRVTSWFEKARMFRKDVLPVIGKTPVRDVEEVQIEAVLERITERGAKAKRSLGGGITAEHTRKAVSAAFNFGLKDRHWRDQITSNPCHGVKRPVEKVKPRATDLDNDQLVGLWSAADKFHPTICAAFRCRLLLGQRWEQTRLMEWSELSTEAVTVKGEALIRRLTLLGIQVESVEGDRDSGTVDILRWKVPASKMKSRREHLVPVPSKTAEIIQSLPKTSSFVFASPSPLVVGQPVGQLSKAFRRWMENAEVHGVIGQDIRRTLRTGLSKLGVDWEVKESILGHKLPGLTSTYDVYDFAGEKLLGLTKWQDHLLDLVERAARKTQTGGKLIEMRQR